MISDIHYIAHATFGQRLISSDVGYLKKVVEKLKEGGADEDKIKAFQKKIQTYYTMHIAPKFGDFDFYSGESMDPDGMYVTSSPRLVE